MPQYGPGPHLTKKQIEDLLNSLSRFLVRPLPPEAQTYVEEEAKRRGTAPFIEESRLGREIGAGPNIPGPGTSALLGLGTAGLSGAVAGGLASLGYGGAKELSRPRAGQKRLEEEQAALAHGFGPETRLELRPTQENEVPVEELKTALSGRQSDVALLTVPGSTNLVRGAKGVAGAAKQPGARNWFQKLMGPEAYDVDYDPAASRLGKGFARARTDVMNAVRRVSAPESSGELNANRAVHRMYGEVRAADLEAEMTMRKWLHEIPEFKKSRMGKKGPGFGKATEAWYRALNDPNAYALLRQRSRIYPGTTPLLDAIDSSREMLRKVGEEAMDVGAIGGMVENYAARRVRGPKKEVDAVLKHIRMMGESRPGFGNRPSGPYQTGARIHRVQPSFKDFEDVIQRAIQETGAKNVTVEQNGPAMVISAVKSTKDAIAGRKLGQTLRDMRFSDGPDADLPMVLTKEAYQAAFRESQKTGLPFRYKTYQDYSAEEFPWLASWFAERMPDGAWQIPESVLLHPRTKAALAPYLDARQFTPPPGYRWAMRVFNAIKRAKMYNIMFHGLHTANNELTGPGQRWDVLGMYRVARGIAAGNIGLMRAGLQGPMRFSDPKEQELALRLARGGVNLNLHDELSKRIDDHLREFEPEADRAFSWLFSGPKKAWRLHEDVLWKGIVRAAAYDLSKKYYTIFTKAGVGADDAARMAAGLVNPRSGLLNPETLSETTKILGNVSLYARNWTLSNPRMFRGAALGKYGHTPIYSPKERAMLQNEDLKTMGRSLFYLYGVPNLVNYWVAGVPMWKNPEGYQLSMATWKQVDPQTGKTTVYYTKPMAFMQDIVHMHGWSHIPGIRSVTKGEPGILETLGNKEAPVPSAIHTALRGTKKFPPGEPLWSLKVVTGPDGKPVYKDGKVQFKRDVLGGLAEIAREAALPSDLGWLSAQGRSRLTSLPYKPSEREPELSPWQKAVLSKLKGHSPEWIQRYLAHTSPIPPMPTMPLYGGSPLAAWAYGSTPRARSPLGAYVQEKGKRREMIGALREMQVEKARERRPKVPGSIDALLQGENGFSLDTTRGLTEEQKRILRKYGVR